jgi:hypothetical protein
MRDASAAHPDTMLGRGSWRVNAVPVAATRVRCSPCAACAGRSSHSDRAETDRKRLEQQLDQLRVTSVTKRARETPLLVEDSETLCPGPGVRTPLHRREIALGWRRGCRLPERL